MSDRLKWVARDALSEGHLHGNLNEVKKWDV